MIRIEKLAKRYGNVRALNGLDMQVEAGVVYGFLGPNGAGKTTTLRILSGLARSDGGQAWVMGQPVGLQGLGKRPIMGVLPEEPAFYPWMTPREYLRDFVAPLYRLNAKEAAGRTKEMLAEVGLDKVANRRIGGFSRGMRQRLGVAAALIHHPAVLFLDEPASALDPAGRKEVLELIENFRGQCTVVMSTHILADVERVCDVVGIIARGRLLVQASRQDLLDRYAVPAFELEAADRTALLHWADELKSLPWITSVAAKNGSVRIAVKDVQKAKQELLPRALQAGLVLSRYEELRPSLEDVFLQLVGTESVA